MLICKLFANMGGETFCEHENNSYADNSKGYSWFEKNEKKNDEIPH